MDKEQIKALLPIDKNNLDEQLEQQASIYHIIGEQAARSRSKQRIARDHLHSVTAAGIRIRVEREKMSKTAAESAIKEDDHYKAARRSYTDACQEHDEWSSLLASWQQRSYALTNLADLYVNQYFTRDSAGSVRKTPEESGGETTSPRKRNRPVLED